MHGEYPSPEHGPSSEHEQKPVEVKNNVLPFVSKEKPKSGTHAESMAILEEMKFANLDAAKEKLIELRAINKPSKDIINEIDRLARVIRIVGLTEQGRDNESISKAA